MDARIAAWARSGAMALTGRFDGSPLGPPGALVERLRAIGLGSPVDPFQLLVDRAALIGLSRNGDVSCGGSSRLLRALDGWFAVTLARDDDVSAVPAWLELDGVTDLWKDVAASAAGRTVEDLEERATLLGIPAARVGPTESTVPRDHPVFGPLPIHPTEYAVARTREPRPLLVVDLSSLWAGPLASHLLLLGGARVVKVESRDRPDGARQGSTEFFDLLNAGKQSVVLDFRSNDGLRALSHLLLAADVVVEAARPRALAQLGISAQQLLEDERGPTVWVSITGHGRNGGDGVRVGFGDDTAAAGGLVVYDAEGPCFCADAIADPLSGIVANAAIDAAMSSGRRWLVDVAMAEVASHFRGPTLEVSHGAGSVVPSTARRPTTKAAPLGRDTAAVLAQISAAT